MGSDVGNKIIKMKKRSNDGKGILEKLRTETKDWPSQ